MIDDIFDFLHGASAPIAGAIAVAHFAKIKRAGDFIRAGKLVVFPTETVYGLGADAFNAGAVAGIYHAKGRPGDNPLILHVAEAEHFSRLAHEPPQYAFALIEKFWPGPLTFVVRKKPDLPAWLGGHPDFTTETIGIRMPAHPVARALIRAAGCVIAAPSANKAGKPSPTSLAHVLEDYSEAERGGIFFLDSAGEIFVGLESTVVDITGEKPVILRPGGVTAEDLQKAVAECHSSTLFENFSGEADAPRSPGMKYKHYAPRAEMTVLSGEPQKIAAYISAYSTAESAKPGAAAKIGALIGAETAAFLPHPAPPGLKILPLGRDKKIIAQNFFANLRAFDSLGVKQIFAEAVSEDGIGAAIMDRMLKAAGGRIKNV